MTSKDIFTPKSLIPAGTMIVTTPNAREIVGHSPSAFMDMWLKAVQPPEWEPLYTPPEQSGTDIVVVFLRPSYGKRHAQTGSMRNKKHRRHAALRWLPSKRTKFTNCHPVDIEIDLAAPGVIDQTSFFNYDTAKLT